MIREFQTADTEQVMQIWLNGNEDAHPFISKKYWCSNFSMVQEQLLQAEVFVYEKDGIIRGFIGITDGYIAGIFVDRKCRSCGIGKHLLEYVKQTHSTLSLGVYQKNKRAVSFYLREGFSILSEELDEATGETEYTMIWKEKMENSEVRCQWDPDREQLYEAANSVLKPKMVSGYIEAGQVAAALMTKSGNIYTGICIDTACSLGMCAERNAIAHMLTCGESEIRKLAVVMSDGTMSLPCGACCEFMMQLGQWAGEIEILIDYQKAEVRQLKDLCPNWWGTYNTRGDKE